MTSKRQAFCGSAAAQCGKAVPFRKPTYLISRLCLAQCGGVASEFEKDSSTARRSLTALCGGGAASQT